MAREWVFHPFPYGLTDEQEKRAERLHRESIIIDMLCQGPVGPAAFTDDMVRYLQANYERQCDGWQTMLESMELPIRMAARGEFNLREWWEASGITCGTGVSAAWWSPDAAPNMAFATMQDDHFPWLIKCLTADDIRRVKKEGKHAYIHHSHNTTGLGQHLDKLDMWYDYGLRVLQLTYNSMNLVGAGCTERTDAGVSSFGTRLIERMNKLGVVVDTGHCGHQTTLDACEFSKAPVIASHTCAKAVGGHARGKSDEELVALARSGGVIGVIMVPGFLNPKAPATMKDFLDHVDYIAKLVGHDHVGIGTDWPMCMPDWAARLFAEKVSPTIGFRPEDKYPTTEVVEGFGDHREFINITRGLVSRGYSDEQIRGILGGNWLRVLDQVLK